MPTINGTTSNEYIDAKIIYSTATEAAGQYTTITAALYYKRNNTGFTTTGTGTFTISINGTQKTETKTLTITENAWVKAIEFSKKVEVPTNGTVSVAISASGSIPSTTLTSTNVSQTFYINVPRATTIDSLSCETSYFNGKMTYKYTPKNTAMYTRCNIAINLDGTLTAVKTINLGKQSASQQTATVTLSKDELSIIYNKLPSTIKGTLRFTFRTYSDSGYSKQVGDALYKEITLSIPDISDTQPTATMLVSPISSLPTPFYGLYIKGRTKVDVNFTTREGKYGASVVSSDATIGGKSYGSPPCTSEYITTDGEVEVTGTVTDSRGLSRTYTEKVNVIPYANPRIIPASNESEIICERCDASGNLSETGTYLKIKAKRSYSKVVSGSQKNFCSIRYRYKPEGGSYTSWTTILAENATSDEVTTGALLGGALSVASSYVVQVGVIDTLGESANTTVPIPTEKVYMHKAGSMRSLAIGKYAEEENTFDVAEDITAIFRGKVRFPGEAWKSLELYSSVVTSETSVGRYGGTGAYYRVCSGEKRICVIFNVSFTTSSSTVRVVDRYKSGTTEFQIPSAYRPGCDVYALCPVGFADGSRGIATVSVAPSGRVNIYAVHKLPGATLSNGDTVAWIDGYIDYWT